MTPNAIAAMTPGSTLKDETVRGLQLRAFQTTKTWVVYYRSKAGVQRRPRLGDYPTLSLADARKAARTLLARVALGEDPSATWEADRATPTVNDLCDRYAAEYAPGKRTGHVDVRQLALHVRPAIGTLRLNDPALDRGVADLFAKLSKTRPTGANRLLALLSKMFNLAETWKFKPRGTNPVFGVARNREARRHRYVTPDEARRIATRLYELGDTAPLMVLVIQLLALTGARRGELGGRVMHRTGNVLRLVDHKTDRTGDARMIHLPDYAVALIEDNRLDGQRLPSPDYITHFWTGEVCEVLGLVDLHLHDLRHTFASVALSQSGKTLGTVGALLGHKSVQTTHGYAHLMSDEARRDANDVGEGVRALFGWN